MYQSHFISETLFIKFNYLINLLYKNRNKLIEKNTRVGLFFWEENNLKKPKLTSVTPTIMLEMSDLKVETEQAYL
jgi:hypothetical protein